MSERDDMEITGRELVVVTGSSGAGKSIALNALADLGYYCVDNLPVPMLGALVDLLSGEGRARIAVGVDARGTRGDGSIAEVMAGIQARGVSLEVVFLDAPESVLMRRFSETRRMHPLGVLPEALREEQVRLAPLRDLATELIDTAALSSRQLRNIIKDRFVFQGRLNLVLTSFGFKHGALVGAELLFDARFLVNPYGDPVLRPQTGFDAPVFDFVMNQPDAVTLADHIEAHLRFQVPRTLAEGRAYLNVGIGCTGGQHRSVSLVRVIGQRLEARPIAPTDVVVLHLHHRDIGRAGM